MSCSYHATSCSHNGGLSCAIALCCRGRLRNILRKVSPSVGMLLENFVVDVCKPEFFVVYHLSPLMAHSGAVKVLCLLEPVRW